MFGAGKEQRLPDSEPSAHFNAGLFQDGLDASSDKRRAQQHYYHIYIHMQVLAGEEREETGKIGLSALCFLNRRHTH